MRTKRSAGKILVVTPTLGDRATLRETVDSVAQCPGIEHRFVCPAPRIQAVRQLTGAGDRVQAEPRNAGVYAAVNDALLNCEPDFEWFGYINDDDYWLPGMNNVIERTRNTKADLLYSRVEFVDNDKKHLGYSSSTRMYRWFPSLAAHGVYIFTQQTVLVRRRVFQTLGGFDERFRIQADNDLWIRAVRAGTKCEYVRGVSAGYRMHEHQLSADPQGLIERAEMLALHSLGRRTVQTKSLLSLYRLLNLHVYLLRIARGGGRIRDISKLRKVVGLQPYA